MIELIKDVEANRELIEKTIRDYGSEPEQNYGYFVSHQSNSSGREKCVYIRSGKYGILTTFDESLRRWNMISTPIAPKDKQAWLLRDALDFLKNKLLLKKFVAELTPENKKAVDEALADSYNVHAPNCVLYWPVYDMSDWEGDRLEGGLWKKIRYMINRITRMHKVKIVDSVNVDKNELKTVIDRWVQHRKLTGAGVNRKDSNRTYAEIYYKFVEHDFTGCKFAKTVLVNGKAASITAGWEVPNSNGVYYSGVGIYDYGVDCLGEYANWSDLVMLKKTGYKEVNFGGSPKPLLSFKQKFRPSRVYTTHIFSITED